MTKSESRNPKDRWNSRRIHSGGRNTAETISGGHVVAGQFNYVWTEPSGDRHYFDGRSRPDLASRRCRSSEASLAALPMSGSNE